MKLNEEQKKEILDIVDQVKQKTMFWVEDIINNIHEYIDDFDVIDDKINSDIVLLSNGVPAIETGYFISNEWWEENNMIEKYNEICIDESACQFSKIISTKIVSSHEDPQVEILIRKISVKISNIEIE